MDAGSYLNTVGSRLGSTIDSGEFFSEGSVFGRPGAATTGAPTTGGPDTFSASTLPDVPAAGSPTGYDVASYGDAAFAVCARRRRAQGSGKRLLVIS